MTLLPSTQTHSTLASDVECGRSLPASWYTDPMVLALEHERIFRRTWQYVGRAEQLAHVGDYITGWVGDVPIVVACSEYGLNGFVNVCRHRRHLVMKGAGNAKTLQCPYHAWSYDLSGCLKAAPRSDREEGFNKDNYPLLSVRVETWGPFVFVNADRSAKPLSNYLGKLPQLLAQNELDLSQLRFRQRRDWQREANWKVAIENYLECYHCPVAHPGFSSVIDVDPDAYVLQAFEWFSSQSAPVLTSARQGSKQPPYNAQGPVVRAQYFLLWPNFAIGIHPGHPNLSVNVWLPDGPSHHRGFVEYFLGPNVPEDFASDLMAFSKQVGEEDDALTTSVQAGLQSGLPQHGCLLRKSEQLVIHFQKLVLSALSQPADQLDMQATLGRTV